MNFALENEELIKQAKTTHPTIVESLFWVMEDAIFDKKPDRAKAIFEQFLYLGKYNKYVLKNLKPKYIDRLKELSFEFNNECSLKKRESVDLKYALSSKNLPFKNESEMRDYLSLHLDIISNAIGEKIDLVGTEVVADQDNDYKCDLVVCSKDNFYPIELKIRQSTHAAISQCLKYCYYFYRKLRYNNFKNVKGIVCANGFDDWSINELRREGLMIFNIVPKEDSIVLERV